MNTKSSKQARSAPTTAKIAEKKAKYQISKDKDGLSDINRSVSLAVRESSMESGIYLSQAVSEGLPLELAIANKPIIDMMIAHSVLPRKTWDHAKNSSSHTLSPQNSERLIRTLRMVEKAKDAFGEESALAWLQRPTTVFAGKAPVAMLTNESGSRAVEMFLERTMHGFNA